MSEPNRSITTLEQALSRSNKEAIGAFTKHVNPVIGKLVQFIGADNRITRAEGVYLYDDTGRRYLDLTAGFGALNLGHNPPEVLAAVEKARSLPNVFLVGYGPLAGALGESLASLLPGELSVAIFGSGGAEAVEHALKTARAATGRTRFVSCINGYHGLSFGAMSVAGSSLYRDVFGPLLEPCDKVPFGSIEALERQLANKDVAAFIVEPVQGEGGAVVPPAGYLKAAAELCRSTGTLLVVDEIQTGLGRTGRLFGIEHDGVAPDMILLSKSLSAGVIPISACVTTEKIWDQAFGTREKCVLCISTFGGNAAACAASLKAVEIALRDDLAARAEALGQYAKARLQEMAKKHPAVKTITGEGLLLGIELDASGFGAAMHESFALLMGSALRRDHDLITMSYEFAPGTLRFEPPLIVTKEEIDSAVDSFDQVLSHGVGHLAMAMGNDAISHMFHRR